MKGFLLVLFCCLSTSVFSQTFLYPPTYSVVKVPTIDTHFVKVFTSFAVNEKGKSQDVEIKKVNCSVCSDSVVNDAVKRATQYIREKTFKKGAKDGKPTKVYYALPVVFKYPENK